MMNDGHMFVLLFGMMMMMIMVRNINLMKKEKEKNEVVYEVRS